MSMYQRWTLPVPRQRMVPIRVSMRRLSNTCCRLPLLSHFLLLLGHALLLLLLRLKLHGPPPCQLYEPDVQSLEASPMDRSIDHGATSKRDQFNGLEEARPSEC